MEMVSYLLIDLLFHSQERNKPEEKRNSRPLTAGMVAQDSCPLVRIPRTGHVWFVEIEPRKTNECFLSHSQLKCWNNR